MDMRKAIQKGPLKPPFAQAIQDREGVDSSTPAVVVDGQERDMESKYRRASGDCWDGEVRDNVIRSNLPRSPYRTRGKTLVTAERCTLPSPSISPSALPTQSFSGPPTSFSTTLDNSEISSISVFSDDDEDEEEEDPNDPIYTPPEDRSSSHDDNDSHDTDSTISEEHIQQHDDHAFTPSLKSIRNCASHLEQGNISRAIRSLKQSEPLSWSESRKRQMRTLHPIGSENLPHRPDATDMRGPPIIDKETLIKLIKRIANGASPGPSGWTAEMLLPLLDDDVCMEGLLQLVNNIAQDLVSWSIKDLVLACRLIAVPKKLVEAHLMSDDLPVRPVAVGEVFYKLAALGVYNDIKPTLDELFVKENGPKNFANGSRGASEKAFSVTQAKLETGGPLSITLLGDAHNAFNCGSRETFLRNLYNEPRLSSTYKITDFAYGAPSTLLLMEGSKVVDQIQSTQGVRQGDVLSMLLFSILVQPIYQATYDAAATVRNQSAKTHNIRSWKRLNAIKKRPPRKIGDLCSQLAVSTAHLVHANTTPEPTEVTAIVDDVTIQGPFDQAFAAWDVYAEGLQAIDIKLSPGKSRCFWPHTHPPPQAIIDGAEARNLRMVYSAAECLGGVIGLDDEARSQWAQERVLKDSFLFDAIQHSPLSAQGAMIIARYAMLPKVNYLSRILPPHVSRHALQDFDNRLLSAICFRLNLPFPLTDKALFSIRQPISKGGLGIRASEDVAATAHWCAQVQSCANTDNLPRLPQTQNPPFLAARTACFDELRRKGVPTTHPDSSGCLPGDAEWELLPDHVDNTMPHYHDLDPSQFKLQREITHQLERVVRREFTESKNCTERDTARLLSCSSKGASAFLLAFPSSALLRMADSDVKVAIRLRLGLPPLPADQMPRTCVCEARSSVTADPWHCMSCVSIRRKAVTARHDCVLNLLATFAKTHNCRVEVEPKVHRTKDGKRKRPDATLTLTEEQIMTDVSITHPTANSYVRTSRRQLGAANARARSKSKKYEEVAASEMCTFTPFVCETYGAVHTDVFELVRKILLNSEVYSDAMGLKNPLSMGLSDFIQIISVALQRGNAMIVRQWSVLKNLPRPGRFRLQALPHEQAQGLP